MVTELSLLISARDAGAAHQVAAVAHAAGSVANIRLQLVASQPAIAILRDYGLSPRPVEAEGDQLLAIARHLLSSLRPHAVLCGLSGPDGGIDEALLASAATADIPTFALQDFWGDVNNAFGRYADTYLVRDRLAAQLTRSRSGSATEVVGSATQARVPNALRQRRMRRRLRNILHTSRPLLLLCSQPLWGSPGYRETLIQALRALPDGLLLVRHHPRETTEHRRRMRRLLQNHCAIDWRISDAALPMLLSAADLLISAYSNTGLDKAQLNRANPGGGGCPVYLLQQRRLRDGYRQYTGLASHPLGDLGAAVSVARPGCLRQQLAFALTPAAKTRCARASRQLAGNPDAPAQILRLILQSLQATQISGAKRGLG